MPSLLHYLTRAPMKARKVFFPRSAERLHLGAGPRALPGWVNIDNVHYPGVDVVLDVRRGLPFRDVRFVFAEHFLEHLDLNEAMYLLRECRRVLRDDGVLRLSTPDLDWVWASHYRLEGGADAGIESCFRLNRAFRGWGHRFLYNYPVLEGLLLDSGFSRVTRVGYGESAHPELRGIEGHGRSEDYGSLKDILIVEAEGRGGGSPEALKRARQEFLHALGAN